MVAFLIAVGVSIAVLFGGPVAVTVHRTGDRGLDHIVRSDRPLGVHTGIFEHIYVVEQDMGAVAEGDPVGFAVDHGMIPLTGIELILKTGGQVGRQVQ